MKMDIDIPYTHIVMCGVYKKQNHFLYSTFYFREEKLEPKN